MGVPSGEGKSKGRKSGEKIVRIKDKIKDELTDDDYEHMNKVNAYVARHVAQKPSGDVNETDW